MKKNIDIKKTIQQIPVKELREFVEVQTGKNQKFQAAFLKHFEDFFVEKESGDAYVEQVQDAFWDATLEGDWVNFSAQSRLSSEIYDVVETARKFIARGNPEPAIEIGFTIIENGIDLINHNDDSCGYLGTIMRLGLELLHDVSKLELDDDCRELFQDYCEDCLKKKILSGWDWDFDIYECLIALLQTPKEARKLIKRIESDEYLAKDYNAERRMKLILRLTEKADGKEAAQRLMMNNLHIEDFRRQAITEAVEAKDFAKAYHLGEEGIALDLDHRPSRVSTWNHCLLKVAQAEHNREKTIDYARHLYIEPYYEEGDFYAILKKNVPKEQWEAFVRKLADDVLKSRTPERYAKICSSEGWHQELMDFVRRQSRIGLLQEYEKQLLPYYRNEIIECYVHYIYRLMEYSRGRDTYREICNYLRRISNYGAKNLATETATDLRTKYRRCRALVDELDHISFDS